MPRRVEGALDDDDAAIRGQSDAFVAKRKDLALLPFAHDAYCPGVITRAHPSVPQCHLRLRAGAPLLRPDS